jgi:2-oxoglutarate dehydrogenase E1 component
MSANFSHLSSSDNSYIDSLYNKYQSNDPELDPSWEQFFKGFEFAMDRTPETGNASFTGDANTLDKEFKVFRIIQSYRARGHLLAKTNPIRERKNRHARLDLKDYGLDQSDLKESFICGEYLGIGKTTLQEIINHMESVYCGTMGVEFMHVQDTDIRRWFRDRIEKNKINFSIEQKKRILGKLNQASVFENFLSTKYVGQKRFSLEGGESTIPALDAIINKSVENGVKEVVIGMAHRGRLNVLANILGKTYEYIFNEFEGVDPDLSFGDGDVKYHLGFTSQTETPEGKKAYLKLMPNPSHLEAVAPVVSGYCRAQSNILYNENPKDILPIIIHGDAAVAGQGIVYELIQMSRLKGYHVGGTIHFIINNQIGFTTDFDDARSSTYCTSVARVINVPVIHVNGDDVEAVVNAVEMASEFRQKFGEDIFIDMVCYRKHGHNEGDEPKFTQPKLYAAISKHKNPREIYLKKLIDGKSIESELAKSMEEEFKELLQSRFNQLKEKKVDYKLQGPQVEWSNLRKATDEDFEKSPTTGVKKTQLTKIYKSLVELPKELNPIKKAQRIIQDRISCWEDDKLNWAMGELLAYGSLLTDGVAIRMSGQDCIRGTFSHRHAAIFDQDGENKYIGLNNIDSKQAKFRIYNSLLSEYAVLGFEYGYSLGRPTDINIWEAQFGDFCNGAQTIYDQFISSGESKWGRMSGLINYLPHGYEGQGPEHSSAKVERFLQLSSERNMVVANCSTPGNLFHLLRRHVAWDFRKPLILFTPKSLLRHPKCVSSISDLEKGGFQEIIADKNIKDKKKVRKLVLCTGKVFYDLDDYQEENKIQDVAVYRLEQLYPLPLKQIEALFKEFKDAKKVWVQEEPKNMGAWTFLLRYEQFHGFELISRKSSASPATGYPSIHKSEQENIIKLAFK